MGPKRRRGDPSGKKHNRAGFITIVATPQGEYALKRFVQSAKVGELPDQWVTDHLIKSFEKILAGAPASKALGLQSGQGNKRTRAQQLRDQMIAAEVEYLYAQRGRGSLDFAITTVARRYSRADSTVRKIYQSQQKKRRHTAKTIEKETKK